MQPISSSAGLAQWSGVEPPRPDVSTQEAVQTSDSTKVFDPALVSRATAVAQASVPEVPLLEVTQPTRETVVRAAQQIQTFLQDAGRDLNVVVDDRAGYYVTTVMNPSNGEVIRQIPPDETLKVARSVAELPGLKGLFLDTKA